MTGIRFPKIKLPKIKWPEKPRQKTSKKTSSKEKKVHPWRLCPLGQHWVRTHPMSVPPSKKNPAGSVTSRKGHCARNPTGKDQLYPDEIFEMTARHFSKAIAQPCSFNLGFPKGNDYDLLIAGWTQYWHEVLKSEIPLDSNLVKALIASESSFDPKILANKKDSNSARGLMQITNATRKILGNEKGELGEHYITATKENLNNPNINICAGIRWLFHKQKLASTKLKRNASWEEAVFEYKGGKSTSSSRANELMDKFREYLLKLQACLKK
ncbi:MAG: transglycosylase SLT domain-containing protein [Deltaproteobacteria bacterium]|nr:transglycosylase SLT domain-containing protein [Deltaproteobacteria bacterium]